MIVQLTEEEVAHALKRYMQWKMVPEAARKHTKVLVRIKWRAQAAEVEIIPMSAKGAKE